MELARLLLIFVPSVPRSRGAAESMMSGSGKTRPYRSLKRRAIVRVTSRWGAWSRPTGTTLPLQARMSAAWWTG